MGVGVYLTKGVYDIFDSMEKLGLKKVNRIIDDLSAVYANSPNFTEIITLGKDTISVENIKQILDNKHSDKDLREFMSIYKNISKPRDMGNSKKQIDKQNIQIKFTDDFLQMLDRIDDQICWALLNIEENPDIKNILGIERLDVSDTDFNFDVFYPSGKRGRVKILQFIKNYFGNRFNKDVIYDFVRVYNKIKNKSLSKPDNAIEVPEFKFNPKDVRSTFISLVTETYPYGHEHEVYQYLPKDLEKDKYGNLYKIIGTSDTVFTCHLDTASRDKSMITLVSLKKNEQEFISSDGTTILGADDKAGCTILMYMMAHNVPGIYYFFLGEERGGIGSGKVADDFDSFDYLKNTKKMVSFDRRNYYSVITEQMGVECCSNEFAESLCEELNKGGLKMGLDPTGIFTDSANFIDYIPECTNISVGYFNEHTHDEISNITFLENICKACVNVKWDSLTIGRKLGYDEEVLKKWGDLLKDIKDSAFYNDATVKSIEGKILISIEFDDVSLSGAYEDMSAIETILLLHKCDPDIKFDANIIKIQIG